MPISHKPILPPEIKQSNNVLSMHDVSFRYEDGTKALDGVTLEITKGEKVALVGPNGAGKSTLMLLMNGILSGEGDIWSAGMPVSRDNLPNIRAKVGMVFQNPDDQLFSPTVFEDVSFGPLHMGYEEEEIDSMVANALAAVDMQDYSSRLSHHLSMGEKKRIAIATVLSMQPEILVLDEPTAGLDPRARRGLIDLLTDLDVSMLVATHDMRFVEELFERTVVIDCGQIKADGPTETLMENNVLLHAHGLERW